MIAAHIAQYPIGLMCRVAGVSYAGFWSWRRSPEGKRQKENKLLLARIAEVFLTATWTTWRPTPWTRRITPAAGRWTRR